MDGDKIKHVVEQAKSFAERRRQADDFNVPDCLTSL